MASRRKDFFPEVTDEQWNDWHWQVKNRIETLDQLKKYIKNEEELKEQVEKEAKGLSDSELRIAASAGKRTITGIRTYRVLSRSGYDRTKTHKRTPHDIRNAGTRRFNNV